VVLVVDGHRRGRPRFLFGLVYASRLGCGRDKRTPFGDGPQIQKCFWIQRIAAAHQKGWAVSAFGRLLRKRPNSARILGV